MPKSSLQSSALACVAAGRHRAVRTDSFMIERSADSFPADRAAPAATATGPPEFLDLATSRFLQSDISPQCFQRSDSLKSRVLLQGDPEKQRHPEKQGPAKVCARAAPPQHWWAPAEGPAARQCGAPGRPCQLRVRLADALRGTAAPRVGRRSWSRPGLMIPGSPA